MLSDAKLSPTTRGIKDIAQRVKRLEAYERSKAPTKIDFADIIGEDDWSQHQKNLERVQSLLRKSQVHAVKISAKVATAYRLIQHGG
jgi:hypothetical protein